MNKVSRLFLWLSLAINFFLIFIFLKLYSSEEGVFRPKPLMATGVTNEISKIDTEFDKVVKDKFPLGLLENELIKELDQQGFTPRWSYKNQHTASFKTSNIACKGLWIISWKTDDNGSLLEINGKHLSHCL